MSRGYTVAGVLAPVVPARVSTVNPRCHTPLREASLGMVQLATVPPPSTVPEVIFTTPVAKYTFSA